MSMTNAQHIEAGELDSLDKDDILRAEYERDECVPLAAMRTVRVRMPFTANSVDVRVDARRLPAQA
jgi:hypothetical protein